MLLAIDVGNSMVNLGVFQGDDLVANLRVSTDARRSADEYGLTLRDLLALNGVDPAHITDVSMCSVVPPLTGVFEELSETYFKVKPLTISAGVRTGLQISYDNPRDVGADRIVDAVAAIELYGQPTIIVDFGTATVFDAVSREGVYLGGAIAPGINVAAEALFLNTSQLRRVELVAPKSAIGQNTSNALQAGLVLGYAGLVTGLVDRFKSELGKDAKVVGTGGLANIISQEADVFDAINQDLTLIGLRLIYELNKGKGPLAKSAVMEETRGRTAS
ncbi:MAG: pantothenate kinase [Chloroflexi bacterium]|nr:pantothenate kinase [Chloroflexota bacterium]